ncbi:MAG: arylesterase [Hyphomicrobiales bacterium]|jgi:acyl-CoA thioesterase-1|nr:arylesterase [Hyphomicrobiales bacterium]
MLLALLLMAVAQGASARAETLKILAFGDSLTTGLGLAGEEAFPAQLQAALRAKGHDVRIVDAGVSGDTAAAGLARLDWSLGEGADGVILELGANDALRGIDPAATRAALEKTIARLKARGIEILLAGMRAPPNMGPIYSAAFDAVYPALAQEHGLLLYPFFLDGVAAREELNQSDGMHPNAAGVAVVVKRILPKVEALIARIRANGS